MGKIDIDTHEVGGTICNRINIINNLCGAALEEEPRWLCGVVTGEVEVWVPEAAGTDAEWVVEAQVAAAPWAAFQSVRRKKKGAVDTLISWRAG